MPKIEPEAMTRYEKIREFLLEESFKLKKAGKIKPRDGQNMPPIMETVSPKEFLHIVPRTTIKIVKRHRDA